MAELICEYGQNWFVNMGRNDLWIWAELICEYGQNWSVNMGRIDLWIWAESYHFLVFWLWRIMPLNIILQQLVNSLWPSDAIWQHRSRSISAQVMAWCLTAPSQYLNQCWLVIKGDKCHSPESNSIRSTNNQQNEVGDYIFKITASPLEGQWVNDKSSPVLERKLFKIWGAFWDFIIWSTYLVYPVKEIFSWLYDCIKMASSAPWEKNLLEYEMPQPTNK